MFIRSILRKNYLALPTRDKLRRNLIGLVSYGIVLVIGLLFSKWQQPLTGLAVIFVGIVGVLSAVVAALINSIKLLREARTGKIYAP